MQCYYGKALRCYKSEIINVVDYVVPKALCRSGSLNIVNVQSNISFYQFANFTFDSVCTVGKRGRKKA